MQAITEGQSKEKIIAMRLACALMEMSKDYPSVTCHILQKEELPTRVKAGLRITFPRFTVDENQETHARGTGCITFNIFSEWEIRADVNASGFGTGYLCDDEATLEDIIRVAVLSVRNEMKISFRPIGALKQPVEECKPR